jgi:hypothetical protein
MLLNVTTKRRSQMDDYLMHYGVLGMKWGVHKANQYDNNEKRVIKGAYSKKMKTLGYSPETIKLANKKIDEQYSEKKRLNKKESRRQMELSKFDPNMSKEDFVKSKYSKAKFKKYQTKKSEYDKRNMTRYKQDLALIAAGFVAPGPIVSDLMGWGAAIANEVRGRKGSKAAKERLDSILNTEISSLSNKITDEDIDRLLKHREEDTMTSQDFNDLKELGNSYIEHYGVLGMKWGHRKHPGQMNSLEMAIAQHRYKRKTKKMSKKHPDLVREKDEASMARANFETAAKDRYHKDKKFKKEVNKYFTSVNKGLPAVKEVANDDSDPSVDHKLETYLAENSQQYRDHVERWRQANDAYRQAFDLLHSEMMSGESFDDLSAIGHEYLEHYGRDGMHWGVRNGPPYPLNKEGLKAFRENRRKKREEKRRRKILNNPKKLAKHIDEFTPEELAEEAYRQEQYNAIGYQRKWGRNKIKLSRKQKRMSNNAISLLNNMDKFNKDEYDAAVDRLHKREHLKDVIVDSANRPAQVLQTGANILGSVKSGIGSTMSMADMYKKAFGGATFDESHAAWLNNNKEPVSGKLWSQVIGESTAAQKGTKYEYKDANQRMLAEQIARSDKRWEKKYATDQKELTNRIKNKEANQTDREKISADYAKAELAARTDLAKEQEKWDFYKELDKIPFENVTSYTYAPQATPPQTKPPKTGRGKK